jgi:hypothetical protein
MRNGKICNGKFNFELRNNVEAKEQVQVEISNRFVVLDIFNTWQNIRGNIRSQLL